jgi:hypothetical protein
MTGLGAPSSLVPTWSDCRLSLDLNRAWVIRQSSHRLQLDSMHLAEVLPLHHGSLPGGAA